MVEMDGETANLRSELCRTIEVRLENNHRLDSRETRLLAVRSRLPAPRSSPADRQDSEDLSREFHRDRADGRRSAGDLGFGANVVWRRGRHVGQLVQMAAVAPSSAAVEYAFLIWPRISRFT